MNLYNFTVPKDGEATLLLKNEEKVLKKGDTLFILRKHHIKF